MGSSSRRDYGVSQGGIEGATESTSLLRGTVKLTEETNELASGISEDLRGQRGSLEEGSTRIREMKTYAGEARRILTKMARRAALHKIMLYTIIVILLILIFLVLYRMMHNHGHII